MSRIKGINRKQRIGRVVQFMDFFLLLLLAAVLFALLLALDDTGPVPHSIGH